ncbi:MAG TPA: VOC family protein [Gammaproteobacteria bacterium]|nr:VOC family protein [Gammaproteobacteria bacterium]
MARLNHLALIVSDWQRSRDWYVRCLALKVEFEVPERRTVALQDESGLTLFLSEQPEGFVAASCTLAFEVDDVEATHRELAARGVTFEKAPQKLFWGYGAELRDPDGYLVYLWDEKSMREKGG